MKIPATILLLLLTATSVQADTYLQCQRLLDGATLKLHLNKTIHVKENRIVDILDGATSGADTDTTLAMGDTTCMPGLIDGHVHITSQQSPTRFSDRFKLDPADKVLAAVPFANRTLMAGFTTVRDLGSADNLSITLRDAIA